MDPSVALILVQAAGVDFPPERPPSSVAPSTSGGQMTRAPLVLLSALLSGTPLSGDAFTAAEMMKLKRLADPQLSPDGRTVLYEATEIDLAAGTRNTDLWT